MKLQIKTQFWDSKVLNDWRKRYSRIGYWVGIFSLPIYLCICCMIIGLCLL